MTQAELLAAAVPAVKKAVASFVYRWGRNPERMEVPTCGGWTGVGEMLGMKVVQIPGLLIPRVVGGGEEVYVFGIQAVDGALNTLYLSANAIKPIVAG